MKFNLPFLSFLHKTEKKEYFLALLLRDEKATAVIFEEFKGKIQILGSHEEFFEDSIEKTSTDDFLQVLDKVISTAESALPPNIETKKTVFGLKENWVEEAKIKKEYLAKLKKASEELGLSPIGFLVIQEAIAHLMQKEEGAPISAILLETGKKNLTVSLFRAGRLIETKKAVIEDSIPETCDKILHHFMSEILPSRIVILDEKNGEKLQQQFISHTWSKSLSFLHVPQAAILPKDFDAKAILFGAAVQMGFEMLTEDDLNKNIKEETPIDEETLDTKSAETFDKIEETSQINEKPETSNEILKDKKTDDKELKDFDNMVLDFGFKNEEDIALINAEKEPKHEEIIETEFIVNKKTEDLENMENFELIEVIPKKDEEQIVERKKKQNIKINQIYSQLNKLKIFANSFFKRIKLLKIPSAGNKKIIFIPIFIVCIITACFLFYTYSLHATVTLNITPKAIEETKEITFSTTKSSDYSKNIINAELISVTQDGELTGDVTGKKEVGTQAKGTVTVYNSSTTKGRSLPKGTAITSSDTSSNNLIFLTDEAVNIASASGDPIGGITSGKTKVAITAKDIGKEYNLPSGTKFIISSFDQSDVIGKNEEAFSGGTKKEITAVSKADLDKLLTDLPKNLEKKANDALQEKAGNEKTVLPVFTNTSFVTKEFDKKIGEEANSVKLTATVSFESFSYKKNDIEKFSKTFLGTSQKDLEFLEGGIKYEVIDLNVKNTKEAIVKLRIKTSLIPNIDNLKLTNDISGKSFSDAQKILLNIPQAENINISLSPNLPFLPKILPRFPKNIKLSEEYN